MKHAVLTAVLDLLYPPKCVFCRKLLNRGEHRLCPACAEQLPKDPLTLPLESGGACIAPLAYDGAVKAAILRYKFHGASLYADGFAELMAPAARQQSFDLITWIPVSRRRRLERGYDQAELLAKALAKQLSGTCVRALEKKHTKRQSASGGRAARRTNVAGAFTAYSRAELSGKRVLLIDDICTTGATLSEAVRVLKRAGAASVQCLTLAITEEKANKG